MLIRSLALVLALGGWAAPASAQGNAKHGEYLVKAAGCIACHTAEGKEAVKFAGGRALKTPFGTFYGPNITPHPQAGIGRWTEADFMRALREGVRPDGAHYYPAFPYPSYTGITESDLRDLWAYLKTVPANDRANQEHALRFPFRWRFLVAPWKWLFFRVKPFTPDAKLTPAVNRGAYLVQVLGHCGECHTPRNFLGAPRRDRALAGGKGPDGKDTPNLTPTGLKKKWRDSDLKDFLASGLTPDGDVVAESMGEVIENTTGKLTPEDLAALIAYLRALPPIADEKR